MLRLMLDSHPGISFAEEFDYAMRAIGSDGSFPTTQEFRAATAVDRVFASSGFTIQPALSFPDQIEAFLEQRRSVHNACIVGATLRSGFTKARYLWPDARYIRLLRDPRDVAWQRMQAGLAGTPWHAVEQWIAVEDEWAELERLVPAERRYTVRFSDLVADHHSALTNLCRFLGVDYTSQMLDYTRDTDFREPSRALAGDWRRGLRPDDTRLVESRVGSRLQAAGFTPSGLDTVELSDQRQLLLHWQDRTGRLKGRMRSYGLRLTAAELAVRAIGHEPLQASLRDRLNTAEAEARKKSWSAEAKYRTSR